MSYKAIGLGGGACCAPCAVSSDASVSPPGMGDDNAETAILYGVPAATYFFLEQKYPAMSTWHKMMISASLGVLGKAAFKRIA